MTGTEKSNASSGDSRPLSDSEHWFSTIALCLCALSYAYLVISVYPYSGYMVIDLIDSVNEENAGSYAGLLASAFMIGRSFTAYAWGKAADIYGRRTILFASLCSSIVFSLLFGLSTSFPLALLWRFLLGLGNGMMSTVKTAVSELAGGDGKRETRAMGIVMAMWGWGFLICPAISGALSEPIRQYPDLLPIDDSGWLFELLDTFPFVLPNLIGAFVCLISIILVALFVPETLPPHQTRLPRYIPGDLIRSFHKRFLSTILEGPNESLYEHSSFISSVDEDSAVFYGSVEGEKKEGEDESVDQEVQLPSNILAFVEDDVEGAIRASIQSYNEEMSLVHTITGKGRGSITNAAVKRASLPAQRRRISEIVEARRSSISSLPETPDDSVAEEATIASLWARVNTRNHMLVYWIASFVIVAVDEGFPLFCISKEAGLGLSEYSIGSILSASGLLFVFLQYFVYAALIDSLGIYGSLRVTSLAFPIVVIVPLSLWLNRNQGYDDLAWGTFSFLSLLFAVYRVFAVAYFTTLMVALNRTVVPAHRGTMNGLTTLGGSITKGLGPTFTGLLVAFSLSSGFLSPQVGAIFMWVVIGGLGCCSSLATFMLLHEEYE